MTNDHMGIGRGFTEPGAHGRREEWASPRLGRPGADGWTVTAALSTATSNRRGSGAACLVDTTMLHAPASGGVKRYLFTKRGWLARNRPGLRHAMVLPGEVDHFDGEGLWIVQSTPLPFGQGYRMPLNVKAWTDRIVAQDPAIIEAGDPYVPGYAALRAGQRLGVPTVAFCHSDLGKLATLHLGGWATKTVRKYWLATCSQFDAVLAPSDYLAAELRDLGLTHALHAPLGVDVETFHPGAGLGGTLRRDLGVASHERLLVFAGRRALEKRVETLIDAVEKLGDGYRLLLVGGTPVGCNSDRVISMPYQPDSRKLAALLSQCDAFVHANPNEPLGLVVLEAMACGLPVVGVASGGIGETVDQSFGELAATSAPGPMAEAMAALFERDQAPLRAAARARAAQRHGWDVAFETLTRVYEGLTGDSAFGPTPGQGPVAVM